MLRKRLTLLLLAATILSVPNAYAQRKGKTLLANGEMLAQSCMGCHGAKGISIAAPMPSISGQNDAYLNNTLQAFRDGKRPGTIMPRLMKGYSDNEIKDIASYFSQLPWTPATQQIDPALVAKGQKAYQRVCKDCHIRGGREASEGDYPLLAGAWLPFMRITIVDVLSGSHKVDGKFTTALNKLTPQEVDAVLHYFAAQQ